MQIEPYLFFEGRCEEALAFYANAIGARIEAVLRYADSPDPVPDGRLPPGSEGKVMHARFHVGGAPIMASDGLCAGKSAFQGFSLSLPAKDEAEARRLFAALAEGGEVRMPLGKTFFSPAFGMVADRFGVPWMVVVPQEAKP